MLGMLLVTLSWALLSLSQLCFMAPFLPFPIFPRLKLRARAEAPVLEMPVLASPAHRVLKLLYLLRVLPRRSLGRITPRGLLLWSKSSAMRQSQRPQHRPSQRRHLHDKRKNQHSLFARSALNVRLCYHPPHQLKHKRRLNLRFKLRKLAPWRSSSLHRVNACPSA